MNRANAGALCKFHDVQNAKHLSVVNVIHLLKAMNATLTWSSLVVSYDFKYYYASQSGYTKIQLSLAKVEAPYQDAAGQPLRASPRCHIWT
jgi:hypothetical protein